MSISFTAIDVETANRKRGSICAVGLAKFVDGTAVESTSWLVDPPGGRDFDFMNTVKNGIAAADVEGATSWVASLERIAGFVDGDLLAHHGPFDLEAIVQACALSSIPCISFTSIDTKAAASAALTLKKYGLKEIASSLNLPPFKHHDAEEDALTCGRILVEVTRPYESIDDLVAAHSTLRLGRVNPIAVMSGTYIDLPPWVMDKMHTIPYSHNGHNAWLDHVLAHPDGRAEAGTPCILCGIGIDGSVHFKYKDRHCCPGCSDKLKRRAKKFLKALVEA